LQKREELSLSYAATLTDARVVDSAYAGPIQEPKRLLILGIAFFLGLAFPAGYIYATHSFNNRITTRKEIEDAVKTPVLMDVNFEKTIDPIVVLDKKKHTVGEHFRMLRTNLHFLHGKRKTGRVTLITSSISEEGKSFIASNLAVALAASGRKTLILELDLRKPKISEIFKLPTEHPGISNYLAKEASIKEIIQASGMHSKLDIIGCGSIPSNPSELLEQTEMDTLIEYLRSEYDDVILETPPVKLVTDALIISRLCDVTLYIIRQGHTHKSLMPFIDNLYQKQYFATMNIVFNGIEAGRFGYGNDFGNGYYEHN
jgi:capsular exopolysaccharide synthesis family protein